MFYRILQFILQCALHILSLTKFTLTPSTYLDWPTVNLIPFKFNFDSPIEVRVSLCFLHYFTIILLQGNCTSIRQCTCFRQDSLTRVITHKRLENSLHTYVFNRDILIWYSYTNYSYTIILFPCIFFKISNEMC